MLERRLPVQLSSIHVDDERLCQQSFPKKRFRQRSLILKSDNIGEGSVFNHSSRFKAKQRRRIPTNRKRGLTKSFLSLQRPLDLHCYGVTVILCTAILHLKRSQKRQRKQLLPKHFHISEHESYLLKHTLIHINHTIIHVI